MSIADRLGLLPSPPMRFGAVLFLSSLVSGIVFGSTVRIEVSDVDFVGFKTSLRSVLVVFAVNATAVTIILIGALTFGLLSSVFVVLLGNFLGIQTAVIVSQRGWLDMLAVTGPHGVFEISGFVAATAAALLPLHYWLDTVRPGNHNVASRKKAMRLFLSLAAQAYLFVFLGAFIEVFSVLRS